MVAPAAPASLQARRYRALKNADTFGVFDHAGDLGAAGSAEGLYHRDTRHLSRFGLTLCGLPPLLLSAALSADGAMLTADFANPPLPDHPGGGLPRGMIHVRRSLLLGESGGHVRISVRSYADTRLAIRLELGFGADFADVFEVRGRHRARRGELMPAECAAERVTLGYRGLDDVIRRTRLVFSPAPDTADESSATFELDLQPQDRAAIFVAIDCAPYTEQRREPRAAFLGAYARARRRLRGAAARSARVTSSSDGFDATMRRSAADLRLLETETPTGPYPYAGIPWFSTVFGRDALITALLMLPLDPALARGVLGFLACEQAGGFDPAAEAEPGKILHELRFGEMARLGEVPYARYYGSVDSTPLFLMLAGAYLERTGDLASLGALWPQIEAALGWLDRKADADGFIRYQRSTEIGLVNQGWKDSHDSISHADGRLASGPIALCEVQGYTYAARLAGAAIAARLGRATLAEAQTDRADKLRAAFEARFWCEDIGTFVLALDGADEPCRVRASNAGHLLLTGICAPDRARRVAEALMSPRMFTGWGIRTLADDEARYNPMSYHNGSVWPHDNAMVALGMARAGFRAEALRVFEALLAAGEAGEQHRLAELFCGFPRRTGQGPTSYPVACSPQAWAAATLPGVAVACLGLSFDPLARAVRFDRPMLPAGLDRLTLHDLALDEARVSVAVTREAGGVAVSVRENTGEIAVITTV